MTAVVGRFSSLRLKIFLLIAGPLLVAGAAGLGNLAPGYRQGPAQEVDRRERQLHAWFGGLLEQAAEVSATALRESPRKAWASAQAQAGGLGPRLEGVGLLGPDLDFIRWEGTPAEPPPDFGRQDWPDWTIRADGVLTRLLVRSGPDEERQLALASFVVDSSLDDLGFGRLLPAELGRGLQLDIVFLDTETRRTQLRGANDGSIRAYSAMEAPGQRVRALVSPDGEVLAVATLAPVPLDRRAERVRELGRAWALVLFLLLLALLFDWKTLCARWWGWLTIVGTVALGRLAMVWEDVPSRLLPRTLGAPSLYGSSGPGELLASPADLLLTAAMIYLVCLATGTFCDDLARRRPRVIGPLTALAASGATLVALMLSVSLARNSRIPLLERPAPFQWDGRLVLWLGLLLALLGAAELWVLLWSVLRGHAARTVRTVRMAIVLVVLAAGSTVVLQEQSEQLAVEQLGSEFAPQVLQQGTRRRVALSAAIKEIADHYGQDDLPAVPGEFRPEYMAYRYWVDGDLFHSRYKSSLTIYTPAGEPLSHFGFGLPPLEEEIAIFEDPTTELAINEEWIDSIGVQPRLLHAEAPVFRDGELKAVIVGHVLDEPDNLPFLPWSQTYLSALGPGAPRMAAETFGGGLHYVLYDALGAVRLTTLLRPPAESPALREASTTGEMIRVTAGDEPYLALALAEEDRQVHLLLLPRRTAAERLGTTLRTALLGLLLLAVLTVLGRLTRPGGLHALSALRASFYRKLLAAVLLASVPPLVGLALFLRGHAERDGDAALIASATQFVRTAQRVVEDYTAGTITEEEEVRLNDAILHWLRRVVGQEIHVYRDGHLEASSTRELFASGLLQPRLDGEVQRRLVREGLPYFVASLPIGPGSIPVAYAPVRRPGEPTGQLVVAVPLVLEQRQIAQEVSRVGEMILLATVALVALLAAAAAALARTVARPVRELVQATGRIAAGDYTARLEPRTRDEVADLVRGFGSMATALEQQRTDLERRRDYIETLLRHATTGVISLDTAGRIVTLNPAATELLAPCADRLQIGADLSEVLRSSEEFEPLSRGLVAGTTGEPVDVDLMRGEEPRRFRWVGVELRKPDGESFGTMILLDDITELMRSNQLAAWAEMARAIAHEIKNPLTPIQLSAEHLRRLLRDRNAKPSIEEDACLETIIKQVRALYDIAGEFSTYAKLPVLTPEPTDPVAFMRSAIGPYRASNPPGLIIEERYEPAPPIAVDRKVLTRAVVNILENALQAMPAGGTVTIGVTPDEAQGSVELSVADTGPGLEPGVRARLFEPYFSTKSSGTGLGLAIARRAVEAHGGTIEVANEPDRGAVFRIRLPIHRPTRDGGEGVKS